MIDTERPVEEALHGLHIMGGSDVETAGCLLDIARYGELGELEDYCLKYPSISLDIKDEYGTTMVHRASANGHFDLLKHLEERQGIVTKCLMAQNSEGNTPLHWAALNGQTAIIEYLLLLGADPTIKNHAGHSAVYEAERGQHVDALRLFLERLSLDDPVNSGIDDNELEKDF